VTPSAIDPRVAWEIDQAGAEQPASTYRVQLTVDFGFSACQDLLPYLAELGVTHLYLSPPLLAARGSTHGYDVVDHNRLSPALGGEAAFDQLAAAARAHGMGLLVDFVPNHMGIGPDNPWWMDVLENGPSSVYAPYFDIDWKPLKDELDNKVLVPVLGDQFGDVLERGELKLVRDDGAFWLHYFEHRFPIAPRQVPRVLEHGLPGLTETLGNDNVHVQELLSIVTALAKLAPRHEVDAATVAERAREKEVAKRRLAALFVASPEVRAFIDGNVQLFNGEDGGDESRFDLLDALLDSQAYRLAHWRVAGEEINYRRFFDVNSLAAIRMEDDRVFAAAHQLVFRLICEGKVSGLRIDHPDGLYAPTRYFRRLQETYLVECLRARWQREGRAETEWPAVESALRERVQRELAGPAPPRPLFVVAEKILEGHERMPATWAVHGTTGYEFLNRLLRLFVRRDSERAFDDIYTRFVGRRIDLPQLTYENKKRVMNGPLASELNMLVHRLDRISEADRHTRDFTRGALLRALTEYLACLPVYRTYVEDGAVDARDQGYVARAIAAAARRSRDLNVRLFEFLRDVLLMRHPETTKADERAARAEFVYKLQQFSSPVTAKAIEDTSFYVYNRLVALNEVGGDPQQFGALPGEFHAANAERLARWPGSLNSTSTHDTKRSEDVRLRIAALSEVPAEWRAHLLMWARANRRHKQEVEGALAPDRNDELLLYQTLIGTWPDGEVTEAYEARILTYLEKALKEAKVHTSWTNPNDAYDGATKQFARTVLASQAFLGTFVPLARRVITAARLSSLSQVALKVASPGVADVYQGCELEDLSLVDPDNRRPVDYAARNRLLAGLRARLREGPESRLALAREVARPDALASGRAKLLLLSESLRYRRAEVALFAAGDYLPLGAEGAHAEHVVALARRGGGRTFVCVAPRLWLSLREEARGGEVAWRGVVRLSADLPGRYVNLITGSHLLPMAGGELDLAELLADFPVALLAGVS
jgi:(1->4)-alpha-D-glucan 1-alpha-D-glucosylmutase